MAEQLGEGRRQIDEFTTSLEVAIEEREGRPSGQRSVKKAAKPAGKAPAKAGAPKKAVAKSEPPFKPDVKAKSTALAAKPNAEPVKKATAPHLPSGKASAEPCVLPACAQLQQEHHQLQERFLRTNNALASAAHDLKTPLAILNGYVELLQKD